MIIPVRWFATPRFIDSGHVRADSIAPVRVTPDEKEGQKRENGRERRAGRGEEKAGRENNSSILSSLNRQPMPAVEFEAVVAAVAAQSPGPRQRRGLLSSLSLAPFFSQAARCSPCLSRLFLRLCSVVFVSVRLASSPSSPARGIYAARHAH